MIVHLNGMPGTGKLTIAKILAVELDAALVDNHCLIDKITPAYALGSEEYLALLEQAVKGTIEQLLRDNPARPVVMTNALAAESVGDRRRFEQIAGIAARWELRFLQVLLTCEPEENRRRLQSESRVGTGKLTDPSVLDDLRQRHRLHHPDADFAMTLDVTRLSPRAAATAILGWAAIT